ncbi:LpqB family beta-propeller domain-containing protein [Actinoplanes sp. NPDC049802]|uniref:LpqB family beta-propeller domain-containing protein n=1 Tax=Actinoplanes sp. NPDC049802 TaxID=3154742 RepID=UPI0033F188DA
MLRRMIAGTAVVLVLLGGCGIPDESDVTDLGPGPSTGTSSGDGSLRSRLTRESTSDRAQFVTNYLQAAAGDYDTALDRVKQFMSESAKEQFNAPAAPRVIRPIATPLLTKDQDRVKVEYELLGTFGKNGLIEPPAEPTTGTYEFTLTEVTGEGLYMVEAPPFLLLSNHALDNFYEERTIYFWNTEYTGLVPDIRYILGEVPIEQEPTIIMGWLIGGPAPWLQDAVKTLPDGTRTEGSKVPAITENRLQVSLSAQAVPTEDTEQAVDRLRKQLQWSTRHLPMEYLDLKIGHQDVRRYSGTDYLSSNPAHRLVPNPERYVVYDRTIRRLVDRDRPTPDSVPGLNAETNKDVSRAAVTTTGSHVYAALVTGTGKGERLRVGFATAGQVATLREVTGLPGGIGYPVWAITPEDKTDRAAGLVIAAGKLWRFRAQGGQALQVSWPGVTGPISAIAVAPDGHRVALVIGGRLFRAVLTVSGEGMALSGLRELDPPLESVTAVDFTSEGWLAVAGTDRSSKRIAIMEMSIDAALQSDRLADIGTNAVSYLTTYPANPETNRPTVSTLMYSTGTDAWEGLSTSVQLKAANLAGPSSEPRPGVVPGAPFFLD